MVYAVYAFGIIFLTCELGQRLTNAFEQIQDEIKKFEWYLFSSEIQQMLPTILIVSQQSIELECFGSISGLRETFKKVYCFDSPFKLYNLNLMVWASIKYNFIFFPGS